jgi:hypothetical protein
LSLDFLGVKIFSDISVFSVISGKENVPTSFFCGLNDDNVSVLDHRNLDAFTPDCKISEKWDPFWMVYVRPRPAPLALHPVGSHLWIGLTASPGMAARIVLIGIKLILF